MELVNPDSNRLNHKPMILCQSCGLDVLRDVRLKIYNWSRKGFSIPKSIDRDVVMSVKPRGTELIEDVDNFLEIEV